jgi:hypothetical protein
MAAGNRRRTIWRDDCVNHGVRDFWDPGVVVFAVSLDDEQAGKLRQGIDLNERALRWKIGAPAKTRPFKQQPIRRLLKRIEF